MWNWVLKHRNLENKNQEQVKVDAKVGTVSSTKDGQKYVVGGTGKSWWKERWDQRIRFLLLTKTLWKIVKI